MVLEFKNLEYGLRLACCSKYNQNSYLISFRSRLLNWSIAKCGGKGGYKNHTFFMKSLYISICCYSILFSWWEATELFMNFVRTKKILYNCLKIYFVGLWKKSAKSKRSQSQSQNQFLHFVFYEIFSHHIVLLFATTAAHVPFGTQNVTRCFNVRKMVKLLINKNLVQSSYMSI